jgi:hypothetical protein
MVLIPAYSALLSEIPSLEQSKIAEGEFSYAQTGKSGNRIMLKIENEKVYFTCREFIHNHHDCFVRNIINDYVGKHTIVQWFEQPIYLFFTQRRIVRIIVEGKEILARETVVKWNEREKKWLPYYTIGLLIFAALIPVFLESQVCRKIEEHEKNKS